MLELHPSFVNLNEPRRSSPVWWIFIRYDRLNYPSIVIYAIFSTRHVGETLVRWRTESRDKLNLLRSWRGGVSGVGIYIIDRTTASWFRVGTSKGARRGYFIYEMAWELKTRQMEGSDEEWIFIEVFKFHLSFRLFHVFLFFFVSRWNFEQKMNMFGIRNNDTRRCELSWE